MLDAIRKSASSWLGRAVLIVIMSVLIGSFAIWGIGDMFRGRVDRNVARVGGVDLGAEQFRTNFNDELRRVQQRIRRPITTEEARAFGLDKELLERMINETALNIAARKFGLALDGGAVIQSIMDTPAFKSAGSFDREVFASALSRLGLSERAFIAAQGDLLLRQQLQGGLVGGLFAPAALGEAVHQFREESRNIEILVIPADKAPAQAEPDDAALQAFYTERKAEFRTSEIRKVTLIATSPSQFADKLSFDEADLRAYYERSAASGRFGSPERRRAQRILFETEAEAAAAAQKLRDGTPIDTILAEKKLTPADVDLGLKTRAAIADLAVRDAVFSLKINEVSAPVKDPFGAVLIRVTEIEPGQLRPFENVRAEIEAEARADKMTRDPGIKAALDAIFHKVEDQRIAGKTLAEAAKEAGVNSVTYDAVDRQGGDGKGNALALPGGAETLTAIYASDIGLDNEPLTLRTGGNVWVEINAVEPARDKAFDEVREEVKARAIADRKGRALAELADGLVKKIDGMASLQAVAGELNLPLQSISGLKRSSREARLGTLGVERTFAGPTGKPVNIQAPDGVGRIIILPVSANLAPYNAENDIKSGFAQQLAQGMGDDLMAQYVASLRKELGVTINQSVLNQALNQPGQ